MQLLLIIVTPNTLFRPSENLEVIILHTRNVMEILATEGLQPSWRRDRYLAPLDTTLEQVQILKSQSRKISVHHSYATMDPFALVDRFHPKVLESARTDFSVQIIWMLSLVLQVTIVLIMETQDLLNAILEHTIQSRFRQIVLYVLPVTYALDMGCYYLSSAPLALCA